MVAVFSFPSLFLGLDFVFIAFGVSAHDTTVYTNGGVSLTPFS